jgi:hypothetical protein
MLAGDDRASGGGPCPVVLSPGSHLAGLALAAYRPGYLEILLLLTVLTRFLSSSYLGKKKGPSLLNYTLTSV